MRISQGRKWRAIGNTLNALKNTTSEHRKLRQFLN
jgi:hypothetical protein